MKNIQISDDTYALLSGYAVGFGDTPDNAIVRLIRQAERKDSVFLNKPKILNPSFSSSHFLIFIMPLARRVLEVILLTILF